MWVLQTTKTSVVCHLYQETLFSILFCFVHCFVHVFWCLSSCIVFVMYCLLIGQQALDRYSIWNNFENRSVAFSHLSDMMRWCLYFSVTDIFVLWSVGFYKTSYVKSSGTMCWEFDFFKSIMAIVKVIVLLYTTVLRLLLLSILSFTLSASQTGLSRTC